MNSDLKAADSHFAFGKNWSSYADLIDLDRLKLAQLGLIRLVGEDALKNRSFLDIGCGSGLHAAAAHTLGAARIVGLDIDSDSVRTTQKVLARFAEGGRNESHECSVFDMDGARFGHFDVVYSWGVLHHTGSMYEAIRRAASMVVPGGLFVFALYRKTRLCSLWKIEKRWYAHASPSAQKVAQNVFIALMRLAFRVTGRDFEAYLNSYKDQRGMDYRHDVHDWMGGYPYESISPEQVAILMEELGFEEVRSFTQTMSWGLFGSGCDEYVYRRKSP